MNSEDTLQKIERGTLQLPKQNQNVDKIIPFGFHIATEQSHDQDLTCIWQWQIIIWYNQSNYVESPLGYKSKSKWHLS